ncbi:MAG: hypothetical protein WCN98_10810, partial [Verrucomicrobiaceae bacterium]
MAQTHKGMNRNLLVLGVITLLALGGIAAFLASRGGGNIFNTVNNITNQIIHNNYFTQLIASGVTTEKDLQAIAEIRPFGDGFIGISKEALPWEQARDLAKRTGSEILAVEDGPAGSRTQLLAWLGNTFGSHLSSTVWVSERGEVRVLDGADILASTAKDRQRKVLVGWGAVNTNSDILPAVATPESVFPDAERKLAESILSKGGRVEVWKGVQVSGINRLADLPAGVIELHTIDTYGVPAVFTDDDSRLMTACRRLNNIRIHNGSMSFIPFKSLPALESLEIASCKMETEAFENLPDCKNMKHLNLSGMPLNGKICEIASRLPSLELLILPGNCIRAGDLSPLAHLKRLKRFGLIGEPLTDEKALDGLSEIAAIEDLRLDCLDLPDSDMNCLSQLHNLSRLTLWGATKLSAKGWGNVASIPGLRFANFATSNITDRDLRSFAGHKNLEQLDLSDTIVSGEGFGGAAEFLRLNRIDLG